MSVLGGNIPDQRNPSFPTNTPDTRVPYGLLYYYNVFICFFFQVRPGLETLMSRSISLKLQIKSECLRSSNTWRGHVGLEVTFSDTWRKVWGSTRLHEVRSSHLSTFFKRGQQVFAERVVRSGSKPERFYSSCISWGVLEWCLSKDASCTTMSEVWRQWWIKPATAQQSSVIFIISHSGALESVRGSG